MAKNGRSNGSAIGRQQESLRVVGARSVASDDNGLARLDLLQLALQPFLRLFLLSEHAGCAFVDDMLANTRTTYTNAAILLLAWRMPYHAEHHCFPSVPFHALVRLNALIGERTQVRARGYFAVHRQLLRQVRSVTKP